MPESVLTLEGVLTLVFSGLVAISTIFYVILTERLVRETRIMRKNQVEPHIIAFLDLSERLPDIVYVKTKNIGLGVALNVRFKIEKDISYPDSISLSNLTYFSEGVNYFPPNHEDKHLVFSFRQDTERKMDDSIIFKVEYESILGEKKSNHYNLRFNELAGKGSLNPPDTHIGNIGYRLEQIEKTLVKINEKIERRN
ncbi:hypothetical protein QWY31_05150 [Cytophagales bacterium LB-30]|uniref:Lysogenic conversion protein n=1 Tax=Shiella aurantiaca TaxID=3058365 RepID=A0ABT8F3S8_9BACT|nr:hypothetical protein [Shiella aurantiaca]MDN4164876.1 hypothetical protein [Shiella aurantiaca]